MKRQLTPEQTAARDAKRERFRALVKQVAAMPDEQRAQLVRQAGAIVTCEGHALSPVNSMLCLMQIPGVSMVGGFRQWLRAGRCVCKGQHGASIWVPVGERKADESATDAPANDGDKPGFVIGTVFDVSQTAEIERAVAA